MRSGAGAHGIARDSERERAGPYTKVYLPSNGSTVAGDIWVEASAQSPARRRLGPLRGQRRSSLTRPSPRHSRQSTGGLGAWDMTHVPNGTYTIQSVVTDDAGNPATSTGVSVTVDNLPLHTQVLVPPGGPRLAATSSSMLRPKGRRRSPGSRSRPHRAARSRPSGRPRRPSTARSPSGPRASDQITGHSRSGSGTWSIQSVATEAGGTKTTSTPVQITLVTLADLVSSSSFPIAPGGVSGCTDIVNFNSGTYPASTNVGTVNLAVNGCVGGFTLTTDVGSVSGSAGIAGGMGYLWGLLVTSGTGLFTGTTGGRAVLFCKPRSKR